MPARGIVLGPRPMEFLVTEDCTLLINGMNQGNYPGGIQFTVHNPAGDYQIRVISQHDSSIYYDTLYRYDPNNGPADNLMVIPLNNKIIDISRALKPIIDAIKYNMVQMDGGEFTMGDHTGNTDEGPEHKVTLHNFQISKYEVTQSQWEAIMGSNPSNNRKCKDCPVENVSWEEANQFMTRLNNLTGEHYRLPSEAEWEFAARGGMLAIRQTDKFSGSRTLPPVGWFYDNSLGQTHPVGTKAVNALGISDMSGNVAEWCADWYDSYYYKASTYENPTGPDNGRNKVVRGGSWNDYDQSCRVSYRDKQPANHKDKSIGFRIAKDSFQ